MVSAATYLNCSQMSIPFPYLGIPIGANPRSSAIWDPIIKKCERKLAKCKQKYISFGRRVTLIKSVLNSIPIYFLSGFFFRIPKKVADKLVKVQRRFLWCGGELMQSRRRLPGLAGDQLAYQRRKGVWELGSCPNRGTWIRIEGTWQNLYGGGKMECGVWVKGEVLGGWVEGRRCSVDGQIPPRLYLISNQQNKLIQQMGTLSDAAWEWNLQRRRFLLESETVMSANFLEDFAGSPHRS